MRQLVVWRSWSFLLAGILTLVAGCARLPAATSMQSARAPVTAEDLISALRERGAAIRTMKAQFSVQAMGGALKGTQHMEAALVYERPASIRLQTFARMGLPVFDLVLIDEQYQIKIPLQGKSLKGRVVELDRQGFLGTPVSLGLRAILGNLSSVPVSPTDHVALREEEGVYVLNVVSTEAGHSGERRLWFDRDTLEVVREEFFDPSGELRATIVFQDYRPVGSAVGKPLMRPYFVRAQHIRSQAQLVLTFHEIVPNPSLTPQDWGIMTHEPTAGYTMPAGES